jgi:hypothetical protein
MNKALLVAAATALALSGSVFAKGNGVRNGANADPYIDKNAQISANDCQQLTVDSARSACMRSAQNGSGMHENVGATSGSGMGQGSGGHSTQSGSMRSGSSGAAAHSGSGGSSNSGARGPMQQGH